MNVLTKSGTNWTQDTRIIATDAANRCGWPCAQGRKVVLELVCYWPDLRRRDVSNLDKVLCDALEGIVYDDDRWALPRWMDFHTDRRNPRVEVTARLKAS